MIMEARFDGKRMRYPHGKYKLFTPLFCAVCLTKENLVRHRIDSKKGYVDGNVKSLCRKHHAGIHKWMRRFPHMTIDELIEQIILSCEV